MSLTTLLLMGWLNLVPAASEGADVRTPWPASELLAGPALLSEDRADRTVLQFWASWCHSCVSVTSDLATLVKARAGVQHLAVSVDTGLQPAQTAAALIAKRAGMAATILHDSNGTWARDFGVVTVPTILVLDARHRVILRIAGHPGAVELQQLAGALDAPAAVPTGAAAP